MAFKTAFYWRTKLSQPEKLLKYPLTGEEWFEEKTFPYKSQKLWILREFSMGTKTSVLVKQWNPWKCLSNRKSGWLGEQWKVTWKPFSWAWKIGGKNCSLDPNFSGENVAVIPTISSGENDVIVKLNISLLAMTQKFNRQCQICVW